MEDFHRSRRDCDPSTSTRRYQAIKRNQTWKGPLSKKKKGIDLTYSATDFKRFSAFRQLLVTSKFHYNKVFISGNVSIDDDIFKTCPLNYPTKCLNCKSVGERNDLMKDLKSIAWEDLRYRNVPDNVPIGIKGLAVNLRSMIISKCDNASAKSFTYSLMETVRAYCLCSAHGEHCDIFTPKLTSDVGGFEFAVNIQQSLTQPSFDSSSDSSRSPTNRMQLRKLDVIHVEPEKDEVSPSEVDHISESSVPTEDSSPSSESPYSFTEPGTYDTVLLVGIPDVVFMNCRQFTIVSAEDKHVKELVTITGPQSSDVGQLLFYMLGIFIRNVSVQNNQQQLGLYIEGDKISITYGRINRAVGTDEATVHFSVSKFHNILDGGVLQSVCLAIFSVINIILDTK
ncbi:PREDICTED: uncharacterized protein LOC109588716 [Amphimedon queenslandica]|uniref:Uncharacterized protein n=1 Tax=Amphimedon queenslandica TaxID=400682 RepID=A0A1X7TBR1_AMPQE|nr:PREDICTED: uncharacterized protein LOC109588716 [Amphimedon queenslandica]XP_019860393.1 PREDICTED: uncharacterized protein LOC109588716 [Amphimedon queenslandica]|eukprot:XP_019860392.1 PREDICTED: uncharacterized protein LOC109588716 [Amphimedon queenslandica]